MKTRNYFMNLLKSLVVTYVLTAILMSGYAFLLLKMSFPAGVEKGMVISLYIIPVLLGGILLGKKQREKKFLWGFLLGFLYILLLLLIGSMTGHLESGNGLGLVTAIIMSSMSGMLGGMIA